MVVTHDSRMLQFATSTIYLLDGRTVTADEFKKATELGLHEKSVEEG
jgi:ABC-type lipoprotein export system ATPase subunit